MCGTFTRVPTYSSLRRTLDGNMVGLLYTIYGLGFALVNAANRSDDFGLYPQSVYAAQVRNVMQKQCIDNKAICEYLEVRESGSLVPKRCIGEGRISSI